MMTSKPDLRSVFPHSLNPHQRRAFLSSLNEREARWLLDYWPLWARSDQQSPDAQPWTSWLILGGRGAGKTRAGAEWVRAQAGRHAVRIALIGETYLAARAVMVEGESGLLNIGAVDERPRFYPSRRKLYWRSGAIAELFSSEDPEALRGPQFHLAWCDELCKWRYADQTWDMLQFALRLGEAPQQVITTTPRPTRLLKKLMRQPHSVITKATTYQNRANLAPSFFDEIIRHYEGTHLGRQELDAELVEDDPAALWSRAMIEENRVPEPETFQRIVVAIDPPAGGGKNSSACGIVAAALGKDNHIYVLGDYSVHGLSPTQWAERALSAARRHQADRLIAEINQGGDMVEAVIRQISPNVPFRAVRAAHGKRHRAEPVAALYEQARVHHCGTFPQLEDQMCSWTGAKNEKSPDRLDALVWAATDLMFSGNHSIARLRKL